MATPISPSEIDKIPCVEYQAARHNVQTGDLVFCSGTYFFSHFIRLFTRSTWSHIGVIHVDPYLNRVFILESETMIGVRLAPLSKYLKDYHGKNKPYKGKIMIARLIPEIPEADRKVAISWAMDELTKPYDNWEILRIAIRILFRIGRRNRDRKYICSELVYEAYRRAGVWFKFNRRSISPDDIWKDERVTPVCRLF